MTLLWTRTWEALAGAFFPTPCVSCGGLIEAHDPPLCPDCWGSVAVFSGPLCRCGAPLPGSPDEECGRCRRGRSVISRGASLGPYTGTLRSCVVALKYQGRHRTARGLARRLLGDAMCGDVLSGADVVVGVPLHPARLRERGFNQADLLAAGLVEGRSMRVCFDLVRSRDTPSQTHLSARDRRLNMRGAFAVRSALSFRDAVVVIVDDVTTTGATLRECALTLLAHGAREVRSITAARAE